MKRLRFWFLLSLTALFVASAAAAAIPGPQRMVAPGVFGFTEVAPNIYAPRSMETERVQAALHDLNNARKTVSRFYQQPLDMPWVYLCPEASCDGPFGKKGARGHAYGAHIIRLNENGINEMIATHEFSHIALKKQVGHWHSFFGGIPAWFDEGLATLLSDDPRYSNAYSNTVRVDLKSAGPRWNWSDVIDRNGWQAAYGESRNMVREIHAHIGAEGLHDLIIQMQIGKSFDRALALALQNNRNRLVP